MTTEREKLAVGRWKENLPNRSTGEKGVADSSKRLIQYIRTNKTKQ